MPRFSSFSWQQIIQYPSFSTSIWLFSSQWKRLYRLHIWLFETYMYPTNLITETYPTNKISTNIYLFDFQLLETNPNTQEKTTTLNNDAAAAWATIYHHNLTTYPTISTLTIQHCYACENIVHLEESWWKQGLLFLQPELCRKMHQWNLKNVATPKLLPTRPSALPPPQPLTSPTTPAPVTNHKK